MERRSKVYLTLITVAIILAVNNLLLYNLLKSNLRDHHQREIKSIGEQLQKNIEQSRLGAVLYEQMIGERIRAAAVAAQHALPPRIADVSQEQLDHLKRQLMIRDLSLMVKTSDDIVVQKSTNPNEVGLSSKDWGLWYEAFQQLFKSHNVSIHWGQALPNFWAGPYEIAASDTKSISKWGYFYDGSTDYMIDPFVDDSGYNLYESTTGTEAIIQNALSTHPFLLEVTGINPKTFGRDLVYDSPNGEIRRLVHRPFFFGTYDYQDEKRDEVYVQQAYKNLTTFSYRGMANGQPVQKTFIPIQTSMLDDAIDAEIGKDISAHVGVYVLCLTTDYKLLESRLQQEIAVLMSCVLGVSLFSMLLIILFVRWIAKSRDRAVQRTSETYADEVNEMFLTIRGQRHDFLNHVSVIHSLVEMDRVQDLRNYTQALIGEIGQISDIVRIAQPEIAAIIQAKTAMALHRKIQFQHDFENMSCMLSGVKSIDVVRVLGNLIDNAMDAVEKFPQEHRWVACRGWLDGKHFQFEITNPFLGDWEETRKVQIFQAGFTTKRGKHSGLGLAITRKIISKYKGDIQVNTEKKNEITFRILIPIV